MKSKVKLKSSLPRKKPKLNEINELTISVFIIKRSKEDKLKERLKSLGSQIISIVRGVGVSRSGVFESLRIGTEDVSVFFATSRVEDVRDVMQVIGEEFELSVPGNGKGFCIDVDGYLGAKALFID